MHTDSKFKALLYKLALLIPDKWYIKLKFRKNFGRWPDLKNPKTFNEKLNWLKLHDRNPLYTRMVDKYEAKQYVADIIGEEYIIPTLGVWDRAEDIDFDALPDKFVLKATHDSGRVIICRDKSQLNREEAIAAMRKSLKRNFYAIAREWPYKNVKPRIIAEQYMEDETGELRDFKYFCFDGSAKAMYIATERFGESSDVKFDFYDMDFNHLPFEQGHPNSTREIKRPETFSMMKNLAEKLSKGFLQLRVDLYEINGKVYFGEMTFYHFSGFVPFNPAKYDEIFGEWIKLHD